MGFILTNIGSALTKRNQDGTHLDSTIVTGSQAKSPTRAYLAFIIKNHILMTLALNLNSSGQQTRPMKSSTAALVFVTVTTYCTFLYRDSNGIVKMLLFFLNLGSSSLFTLVGVGIQYPDGCYAHGETNLMALSGADVVLEDCLHACDVS